MEIKKHYPKCLRFINLMLLAIGLACWSTAPAAAQSSTEREIKGIVTDENGEPLPGAQIIQIRQNNAEGLHGAVSDINGHFYIVLSKCAKQIEASYIGYRKKIINLTQEKSYIIELEPGSEMLDEVLVTGYQSLSRERATGSFTKVEAKQLEAIRPSSVSNLLEGQIAGYQDGLIRGVTSMNGATAPLYVIDGFPIENTKYDAYGSLEESIPSLNMEDIESITVLKDAAAASIYGARAANGVIVITTKKAKQGKAQVSFSATLTMRPFSYYTGNRIDAATMIDLEKEWAQNNPNLQDPAIAADYAQTLLANNTYTSQGVKTILKGYTGQMSQSQVDGQLAQLANMSYNYYDQMEKYGKRNPLYQQYNLSIGKATDKDNFNLSLTYKDNQESDRYTSSNEIGINLTNTLKVNRVLTIDAGSYINYGRGTQQSFSLLAPEYTFMPYDLLRNQDGTNYTSLYAERASESNVMSLQEYGLHSMDITPLDETGRNLNKRHDFESRLFAKVTLNLTDWLNYTAQYQYENDTYETRQLLDKNSYAIRSKVNAFTCFDDYGDIVSYLPYGDQLSTRNQRVTAYNFRQQLNLHRLFSEKHDLTALIGSETRHSRAQSRTDNLYNYDDDLLSSSAVDYVGIQNAYGLINDYWWGESDMSKLYEIVNRYVSFYGNAGYTFDDRYTITGSLRWDRSNLWGTDGSQNKPSWSVGTGWNVHNESFLKETDWINMLKVRASYGIGGNVSKNSAPYMTAYYNPNYNVGGMSGTISNRPNPSLTWEKTATTNVGVDFSALNGLLNVTLDYYHKKGTDLLASTMGVPTEGFGYNTYEINNGEMTNRGIEWNIKGDIIRTRDITWHVGWIFAHNKNEVTYVNVKAPFYVLQFDYPEAYPIIGNPYQAIYAYRWAGLNSNGQPQVYDAEGNAVNYDPSDLDAIVYAGSKVPTYSGSFSTLLHYKHFDLSLLFTYAGGHKVRNTFLPMFGSDYNYSTYSYMTSFSSNVSKEIADRWKQPGDETKTDIPAVTFAESDAYNYSAYDIYNRADINVVDAGYVKLKNLSLAWHVPSSWTKKAMARSARLQFNIENVHTWAADNRAKYLMNGYEKPNFVWGIYINF